MIRNKFILFAVFASLSAGSAMAGTVRLKLSGDGAVNDSTIKVGQKVSVDIYTSCDVYRTGLTLGFSLKSPDIKKVIHVSDSAGGLNDSGDVKGHNGWHDKSVWDFAGVMVVERDWDGVLPDMLGFGALAIKQGWQPGELVKSISFEIIVPETGTLVIDSAYYPPGGKWLFASPPRVADGGAPDWDGPYTFKVIK